MDAQNVQRCAGQYVQSKYFLKKNYGGMQMKRDSSLDIIRILAIWMIVNYHFSHIIGSDSWFTCSYANGGWGCVGTTVFFILSGYVLRMKYKKTGNLLTFYKKRWLSIYPMFYVAFLCSWIYIAIDTGTILYNGAASKLKYTLLGIDGYVVYWKISTYYRGVGEWFTAIIVAIYILYPLINLIFAKAKVFGTILLAVLYLGNVFLDPFAPVPVDANLLTGLFMFWIGMLIEEYSEQIRKQLKLLVAFVPIGLLVILLKLPGPSLIWKNLLGIMVFMVFYLVFSRVKISGIAQHFVTYLSSIAFAVYLTHHFILVTWKPYVAGHLTSNWRMLAFYICYMIVTILCSIVINSITNFGIKLISNIFKILKKQIINKESAA